MVETILIILLLALCLYCLFGGADFGAGILSLFTPSELKSAQRKLVTKVMGPVWEANHVWLILAIVILFTAFPKAYAQMSITFHVPLTLMLLGIIFRGCSFTFRHYDAFPDYGSYYWRAFEVASLLTPFFLGVVAAGLIRGQIEPSPSSFFEGYIANWLNLFSFLVGFFLCALFTFLAAVYLVGETENEKLRGLCVKQARYANLVAIVLGGAIFLVGEYSGIVLVHRFFTEPWSIVCFALASLTLVPLWLFLKQRRAWHLRVLAGMQIFFILAGWFCAQFPVLLFMTDRPYTFYELAAPAATLKQMLIALAVGSCLIVPAFVYLLRKQPKIISN